MSAIREDAEGGLNTLIQEQEELEGKCTLTLVQFDNAIETVHNGAINGYRYKLEPRSMTALYDAIATGINRTGHYLSNMKEEDRPGLVLVVIVTDGLENASREFSRSQIDAMLKEQQEKYNWKFTFLCNDLKTQQWGASVVDCALQANMADKAAGMYQATSAKFTRMRGMSSRGLEVSNSYTDEEIEEIT